MKRSPTALARRSDVPKSPFTPHEALSQVVGDVAARVVVGTGTTSAAVSTIIIVPSVATRVLQVNAVARVMDCAFVYSDESPSYMDLPLQFSFLSGKFALYAGSSLASCVGLLVLPSMILFGNGMLGRRSTWLSNKTLRILQERVFSNFFFMALGYVGPNLFFPFALVVAHDGSAGEVACVTAASAIALILITLLAAVLLSKFESWFVFSPPTSTGEAAPGMGRVSRFGNREPGSMMIESFGCAFDAARSDSPIVRVYFTEELLVSVLLQSLSGIRPKSGLCVPVAGSMVAVAVMNLLYATVIRPYSERPEILFAGMNGVLLLAITLIALLVTLLGRLPDLVAAFGVVVLLLNAGFFLQLVVGCANGLALAHRMRLEHQWRSNESVGLPTDIEMRGTDDGRLVFPLLCPQQPTSLASETEVCNAGRGRREALFVSEQHRNSLLNPLLEVKSCGLKSKFWEKERVETEARSPLRHDCKSDS